MTFAESVLKFYSGLKIPKGIPHGIEVLYPFGNPDTWSLVEQFLSKYYDDTSQRVLLMGINPGRFGAGATGIGFTDPIRLQEELEIKNDMPKKPELSSKFIYDVIQAYGGPEKFYAKFFISSVCPLGFVKNGKNYNYYDEPGLVEAVQPFVIKCFQEKLTWGCSSKIAFSVGQGKNIKFLDKLNAKYQFFDQVKALPHPRWVMQYRLKRKEEFIEAYLEELNSF